MSDERKKLDELMAELRQHRDELRVQMHLAKQEAKEEWGEVERKFDMLERKFSAAKSEAGDAAGDVFAAARLLGEEVGSAFKRIRNRLS